MMRGSGRLLGWFALLGAALLVLRFAATGDLAVPPLTSLDALEAWVDVRGPIPTALALVRLLSELVAWYLLAISVLHVMAGALRIRPVHALADALAVPGVRRVVHGALGMSLVAVHTTIGPPTSVAAPAVELLPEVGSDEAAQEQISIGTATMRPVGRPYAGTATMTPVPAAAPVPGTWTVDEGESFWTIAADILEVAWDRPPTDREVDPFWRALVSANRERLVDRGDPDLVLPGQVFDIPPVPPPR